MGGDFDGDDLPWLKKKHLLTNKSKLVGGFNPFETY